MNSLQEKQTRLEEILRGLGSVLIAYSGGIDSAYLAWCAHRVLGKKMLAMIADSPSLARSYFADALYFAREHDIPLEIVRTEEMENEAYVRNDLQRCFHCKNELFAKMTAARAKLGFAHLAYGRNTDDQDDFQSGQKAALNYGVRAPLAEASLEKKEIRQLAREANLRLWDKPASACLLSRLAYGQTVTREKLQRIEEAEDYLRSLGLAQFRVRDDGDMARIEIAQDERKQAFSGGLLETISAEFQALGFKYVAVDGEGLRPESRDGARNLRA